MQKWAFDQAFPISIFCSKLLAPTQFPTQKGTFHTKKEQFDPKKEQSRNKKRINKMIGCVFVSNNESLLLELFGRIKTLEEKVESLENAQINTYQQNDKDTEKITRSVARRYVINQIKKQPYISEVIIGNRSTAADLIIKNGSTINAKFYYSKSYLQDIPSSWYTVSKTDLNDEVIDLYIFTMTYEKNYHTLLFTSEQLKGLVHHKQTDSSDKYHFYFHKRGGHLLEVRDEEIDVTNFYEKWNAIHDL